ncbi:MAG: phosphotransferase, partial [Maribacter sp.]|nr:phosphotransferase [Maribacter sp.]
MGSQNNDTISTILQHFCVAEKRYDIETINNGYINDTYMVLKEEQPIYILQRINHHVFSDINGIMANINSALIKLDDAHYRKIELIKTTDGLTYYENEKGYWRLMSYIDNTTTHNTTKDVNIAFEAGRIIGKFHQLMEGVHQGDFVDTIPNFHNLELREKQFRLAKANADITHLEVASEALLFAEKILAELK